jgi:hypothetical protein
MDDEKRSSITTMKTKTKKDDRRTLFVRFQNGEIKRVAIPAGCKVTFGPLCPGTKGEYNGEKSTALRVYSGASQIAVFVKVDSFYETDSVCCISKKTKRAVKVSEWKDELVDEDMGDNATFIALKNGHDVGDHAF